MTPATSRIVLVISAFLAGIVLFVIVFFMVTGRGLQTTSASAIGGPFNLIDQHGKPISDQDFKGRPFLVFFGYTHCPDICNVVLANFASALRGATPAVRKDVRMLFVTTDPARDTPDVVRAYLDRFDPTYEGLVAPAGTVEKAAKALYISYERPDGSQGGNYMVSHGTYTTAFLHGSARVVWSADTPVADLRADLTRLARLA